MRLGMINHAGSGRRNRMENQCRIGKIKTIPCVLDFWARWVKAVKQFLETQIDLGIEAMKLIYFFKCPLIVN
jgi:hypothetical protein